MLLVRVVSTAKGCYLKTVGRNAHLGRKILTYFHVKKWGDLSNGEASYWPLPAATVLAATCRLVVVVDAG